MIKIIVSIFTIYQSAFGNRLLLQIPALPAQPGATPSGPPAIPAPPANPAATSVPASTAPGNTASTGGSPPPAAPAPPVQTVGAPPAQPVGPQQPQPQPQTPGTPATPQYPWQYPGAGMAPQPSQILECRLTPPAVGSCSGKTKNVINPAENFEVGCTGLGGCYASTINIAYGMGGVFVETMKGVFASENYALAEATVNFYSQRSDQIYIEKLVCDKTYSCLNTKIVLGQNMVLESGSVFCGEATSCQGCMVYDNPLAQGIPCTEFI